MGNNEVGVEAAVYVRWLLTKKRGQCAFLAAGALFLYTFFLLIGSPGVHHFAMKSYPCATTCGDPRCVAAASKPPDTSFVLTLPKHVERVDVVLQDPLGADGGLTPLVLAKLPPRPPTGPDPFTILVMPSLAQTLHNEAAGVCEPVEGRRRCLILNAALGGEQHAVIQVCVWVGGCVRASPDLTGHLPPPGPGIE